MQALVTAQRQGLYDVLVDELGTSQQAMLEWMQRALPGMPPKAQRWIGEMEEHGRAYEDAGLVGDMMTGAADLYRLIADTPPGRESQDDAGSRRDLAELVRALAEALPE